MLTTTLAATLAMILFSVQVTAGYSQQLQATWRRQLNSELNLSYNGSVDLNHTSTYIFSWKTQGEIAPFRIYVETPNAHIKNWPLVVVAKQGSSVLTVTLPFWFADHSRVDIRVGQGAAMTQYQYLARTMCPAEAMMESTAQGDSRAIVELSSSSETPINFTLIGSVVDHFALRLNDPPLLVELQPSMPQYYWFNFSDHLAALNEASAVRVIVRSNDSHACLAMSIQTTDRCLVWDTPENIDHSGLRQMVLTKGDIYVSQEDFPFLTFFVVLLGYPSSGPCLGYQHANATDPPPYYNLSKSLTVEIVQAPVIRITAMLATVGLPVLLAVLSFVIAFCIFRCSSCSAHPAHPTAGADALLEREDGGALSECSGVDIEYMSIALLNRKPTNRYSFVLQICVIGMFYSVPVIQLMLVLIKNISNTGDLDSCFYNFACSVKLNLGGGFEIYAFNNVLSNIGYLAAGAAFLLLCGAKHYYIGNCQTGVPDCYSLYYASGAAVIMEGVMSAAYHLCPSRYNFQFDTAFMIMLGGLLILLLYSKRHPDVNATAHIAYLAIGAFILANTLGILFALKAPMVIYSILLVLHVTLTAWTACQVYYLGQLRVTNVLRCRVNHAYPADRDCQACADICDKLCHCRPRYPATLMFLVLAVIFNVAAAGVYMSRAAGMLDGLTFSSIFLGTVIMNFLLYLAFYLLMKLCSLRRTNSCCNVFVTVLLIITILLSAFALLSFVHAPTDWTRSPAMSRRDNQECKFLDTFDVHDQWHFLSAGALFSLLVLIFCLDANENGKRRDELPVF